MTDTSPAATNAAQIAEWNGEQGRRWAELQVDLDGIVLPFGETALQRAAPAAGEQVVDIGCGCGATALALARRVGPSGRVLGVDVSAPMLAVARAQHAAAVDHAALAPLAYCEADAAVAALPAANDLLFSRFGLMFFDQPAQALAHLRGALRPGGRLVFVCWRTPRDNAWAVAPLMAARQALGLNPPPADPNLPGPFAFADEARLRGLLAEGGFVQADVQRFDAPVLLGSDARTAAENAARIGPVSRLVREVGVAQLPKVLDAIVRAVTPLAGPDGGVRLNGSTWIVSALNPPAA